MSLLSEDQIEDLWERMSEAGDARLAKIALKKWNAKQEPVNVFKIDWDDAPKWAETATICLKWVGAGNLENVILERHEKPKPVITPHLHAEIMMKYAEVAQRRVDPWVEFEFKSLEGRSWEKPTTLMSFYVDWQYRYVGEQQ